jgi:tRNA modification GTPase
VAARDAFLAGLGAPLLRALTKSDLSPRSGPSASSAVSVSTLTGAGLAELRRALAETAFGRLVERGDVEPMVTRARHRAALERALAELEAFAAARAPGIDAAAAATHLRDAVAALDELIGAVTPDDVLDRVFATFCVGK